MYLKIHCDYCGQDYELYERDSITNKKACQCPHCKTRVDRDIWLSTVVPAFKMAQVANRVLYHNHANYHKPLFAVSFVADHLFPKVETKAEPETESDISDDTFLVLPFEAE